MTATQSLRLAYVPARPDFSGATDRRRVIYNARKRGHMIEAPRDGVEYDAVVVPYFTDVSPWLRQPKGRTKLVVELSDSYLHLPQTDPLSFVRGPLRFFLGQHRYLEWNTAHGLIERMARRADAVVCSMPGQGEKLLAFNPKVHAILDVHAGEVRARKATYARGEVLNLFWEGFGINFPTLTVLAEPLRELARERPLALDVVSDPKFRKYNGPVAWTRTDERFRALLPGVRTLLYEHNDLMLSPLATNMDLAVIPMSPHRPLRWAKADNKLLLMWRMGLPTQTSPTPAYRHTMAAAGVEMRCASPHDWLTALRAHSSDPGWVRPPSASAGRTPKVNGARRACWRAGMPCSRTCSATNR